jgi:glyoxylase-like metal-dependent hydrolase (beta-lactamase superfamily II)
MAAPVMHAQILPDWCKVEPRAVYSTLQRVPAADPWFEVYRVAPDTYAIYEPHEWEETIGYLLIGHDRAMLFDSGMGIGDVKRVVRGLTALPVVVLNSHTHNDHVGGNWLFETAPDAVYSMDTPYTRAHAAGSEEYEQSVKSEAAPGAICGALPAAFDRKTYITHPWHVARWLHDGDTIDLGNRTVEVIATPGHAPDAICLFDRGRGLLFTGDSYYNGRIFLMDPQTELLAYDRSMKRIASLAPQLKLLLPAHNEPVASPSVLPALVAAYDEVLAGHIVPKLDEDGASLYTAGTFRFLIRGQELKQAQLLLQQEIKH